MLRCRLHGGARRFGAHGGGEGRGHIMAAARLQLVTLGFYCATHICIARLCCGNVSGCLAHAGIVSKRLEISSNFFLGLVARPIWFSNTALLLRNSNRTGNLSGCHSGGLREIFSLIETLSNGSAVRPYGLPIRLLPPHSIRRYGGVALADTFPPSG